MRYLVRAKPQVIEADDLPVDPGVRTLILGALFLQATDSSSWDIVALKDDWGNCGVDGKRVREGCPCAHDLRKEEGDMESLCMGRECGQFVPATPVEDAEAPESPK